VAKLVGEDAADGFGDLGESVSVSLARVLRMAAIDEPDTNARCMALRGFVRFLGTCELKILSHLLHASG
jgi:hypothetical protein